AGTPAGASKSFFSTFLPPVAAPPSTLPAADSAPVASSRMALLGSPSALRSASALRRSPSAAAVETFGAPGGPLMAGAASSGTSPLARPALVGFSSLGAVAAAGGAVAGAGAAGAGAGSG